MLTMLRRIRIDNVDGRPKDGEQPTWPLISIFWDFQISQETFFEHYFRGFFQVNEKKNLEG